MLPSGVGKLEVVGKVSKYINSQNCNSPRIVCRLARRGGF